MAKRITIIGDGAMGTVCALLLAQKGADVVLWGYLAEAIEALRRERVNRRFLPGVVLPAGIEFTGEDAACFRGAELVVSAVPCRYVRGVWGRLVGHLPAGLPIVSVAKGIENDSLLRPTQILAELTGRRPLAALSGPNIAEELARALPATSTVASEDA
ncbi:MAG: NAD(P)-binding domain-containing protein, partial [Sedimentisphaerales bacterium]|nr:NAD(P)-binding domain-containing protein [Sedimentisphaerales bacterium]